MTPDAARARGPDQHRHFPARQPRAARARSSRARRSTRAWSTPTASTARRGPARVFTDERDAIAAIKGSGRTPIKPGDVLVLICRGPMGTGHGGDLPDHLGAASTCRSASTSPCSPTRGSPASRPARASATSAPRRWPAARSASCATATSIEIVDRPRHAGRVASNLVGADGRDARRAEAARGAGGAAAAPGPGAATPSCPTTRGCGRRCSRRAAAPGAAASTTSIASSR